MSSDPDFGLNVVNPAVKLPVVFVGLAAQLDFSLRNTSDDPSTLHSAVGGQSSLEIKLPSFFTLDQAKAMNIQLPDWTLSVNEDDLALVLTYTGADGVTWGTGQGLDFSITNVMSTASPSTDPGSIEIDPANIDHAPSAVGAPLQLQLPPQPGNASLKEVLQVELQQEGVVFVSKPIWDPPIANSLLLTLRNVSPDNLYTSDTPWDSDPTITVSFVYGKTSGALAPDDDKENPRPGSAWTIAASIPTAPNDWHATDPDRSDPNVKAPSWVFRPDAKTNTKILGSRDSDGADVTFAFGNIASITPAGSTQMLLQFKGFRKSKEVVYDEEMFVCGITKKDPPPVTVKLEIVGPARVGVNGLSKLKWDAPTAEYCMLDDGTRLPASGIGYFILPKTHVFTINAFRSGSEPAQDQRTITVDSTITQTEAGYTKVGAEGVRGHDGTEADQGNGDPPEKAQGGAGAPGDDVVLSGSFPPLAATDYPGRVIPITLTGGRGGAGGEGYNYIFFQNDYPTPDSQPGGRGGDGGTVTLDMTLNEQTQPAQYLITIRSGDGGASGICETDPFEGGLGDGSPGSQPTITIDGLVVLSIS